MAEAVETVAHEELALAGPSSETLEIEADEKREEELLKKSRLPPIVYKDIDVSISWLVFIVQAAVGRLHFYSLPLIFGIARVISD